MLQRQLKEVRFGAGLNTKGDDRAQPEQELDIGVNIEFDDIGGYRCRFPFDAVRSDIVGGGTLTGARKLAMLGDELVCFTATALYSWIPALSAWEYRGDHLAVATDEQTVFATPGDQDYADRAEFNGHIVYCWQSSSDGVRIAVRDKSTGAMVQGPTTIRPSTAYFYVQPRLVALSSCVLLFWINFVPLGTTTLMAAKITVAPYTYTVAGAPIATYAAAASNFNYDVCRIPGQDRCYAAIAHATGGIQRYTVTDVNASFAGATTNGTMFSADDRPIAIAVSPGAAFLTVVNTASSRIYADVWNVTTAGTPITFVAGPTRLDATVATQGAGPSQVTAAYRLTQDGGHYRCYVFWSRQESAQTAAGTVFGSFLNWIDSTTAIGTDAPFVYGLGIAARAFAHDSHVYLVGVFAGLSFAGTDPSGTYSQLQNTYYLYRDDAFLLAKAVWGEAGGFHATGWLPGVVADASNANSMVFMGGIRRIVPVGINTELPNHAKNYAERAPREIAFTFDDDRARRCVQFGETLYVLGGIILQYDGAQLVELGTCTYPWEVDVSLGSSGTVTPAGYSYKATDRWTNAKGETDRSTTGTVANYTLASPPNSIVVSVPNLYITRKTGVALEIWRTKGNPAAGVPFFLVTSQDPSVITGNNDYLTSDPTSNVLANLTDNLSDAQIAVNAANPENGAILPGLEPPPATIVYADNQRIYLAGIPGYPNTIYYSKYRQAGFVAAFNDALTIDVPTDGGAITAIGYLDGALIVWCETATYQFAGAGFDDTGGGGNFQLARILSLDLGCVAPEACAYFDGGFLVKTNKGWYVLDRSLNYEGNYVGSGAYQYDDENVFAMTVLTGRHQIRVQTGSLILRGLLFAGNPPPVDPAGRILVFDTLTKQWAETSIDDGLDMVIWAGTPAYLTSTGVRAEISSWDGYDGSDYTLTKMDVETGWIKFGDSMQSRAIVDAVQMLGEFRSACAVRMRIAKNYEATAPDTEAGTGTWNYHTDRTWTPYPTVAGSSLQLKQAPRWKRCEALKTRITITAPDGTSPLGGPCVRLTSIAIPHAIEPNAYSALAAAQKQ